MAKISIIVPVYNAERYLEECIHSILGQTYQDIEVILIDDGSNDSSLEICRKYAKKDRRIVVLHKQNGGSTSARKAGLKAAQGEYISFVDSDDWVDSYLCERLYGLAKKHNADIVASGCIVEQIKKTLIMVNRFGAGAYDKQRLKETVYPQMLYFECGTIFEFGILQYLWGKLFKKDIIEPCLLNLDERIFDGEDVACVFDACLQAHSIVIDNHPYYHYRRHDNSVCTGKRDEKYFVNAVYLYHYLEGVFQNSEYCQIMRPQLKRFMNFFINNGTLDIFGFGYKKSYSAAWWSLPPVPVNKNCKIAIFSAGNVGQSYYKQLRQMENIEVVLWVDNYNYGRNIEGMLIAPPESLVKRSWDYVLIAVKNKKAAEEIREWLLGRGITQEKILYQEPELKSNLYEFYTKE